MLGKEWGIEIGENIGHRKTTDGHRWAVRSVVRVARRWPFLPTPPRPSPQLRGPRANRKLTASSKNDRRPAATTVCKCPLSGELDHLPPATCHLQQPPTLDWVRANWWVTNVPSTFQIGHPPTHPLTPNWRLLSITNRITRIFLFSYQKKRRKSNLYFIFWL